MPDNKAQHEDSIQVEFFGFLGENEAPFDILGSQGLPGIESCGHARDEISRQGYLIICAIIAIAAGSVRHFE